jgi:hypothetical protein
VVDVAPITGTTGKQYGLVLNVSGYLLALYANADELRVRLLAWHSGSITVALSPRWRSDADD